MNIKTENHDNTCGYCKAVVPSVATLCGKCGAYWGIKDGTRTRNDLYEQGTYYVRIAAMNIIAILVFGLLALLASGQVRSLLLMCAFVCVVFFLKMSRDYLLGLKWRRQAKDLNNDIIRWWKMNKRHPDPFHSLYRK